ncbi:hypothetical protein KJ819_01915 [Patescibacteria group bacterium]|nr:hypothetical protein [Patescibacteria group bacterium]MBU1500960.1 hypothetical protein [Patescibacteria group bacterium]MBU2080590.1 hypothetical protein [Patescibacteria group bacterium]
MKKFLILCEILLIAASASFILFGFLGLFNLAYIYEHGEAHCSAEVLYLALAPFLIGGGLYMDWLVPKVIEHRREKYH